MKTYIIHFDKLKDRKKQLKQRLKKCKSLDVKWFIQRGYYPKELINKYYEYDKRAWKEKVRIANRSIIPRVLTKSEIHLSINHLKVIEKTSKGKELCALILEDDSIFVKDFEEKLKEVFKKLKGKPWDIIYLDYLSKDYPKVNKLVIVEERGKYDCYGAAAYIIKKEACKKILKADRKITLPFDEELKYRINKLGLKPLWVVPPLVKQESVYGNAGDSGQDAREKQGIKKYIFWRKKGYSMLPQGIEKFIYKLEDKIKRIILGIK